MSVVNEFFDETKQLLALLKKQEDTQDRDQQIEQINTILDRRQSMLLQMKPPYTKEEETIGQKCIVMEKEIQFLLKSEKEKIQKDMKSLKNRKDSREKYVNPYKSINHDGMFYDKRK